MRDPGGQVSLLGSHVQLMVHVTNKLGTKRGSPLFVGWDYTQGPLISEAEMGIFLAGMAVAEWERTRGEESPAHMTFVSQRLPGTDPLTYVPVYVPELGNMHVGHIAQIDSGLPVAHSFRCRFCDENGSEFVTTCGPDDFERHLTDTHGLRPKGGKAS